ncbi:hypothetical protein CEXT_812791 [Caerostris extrusa]|uniref:Uncharacterized protein n=1 Tax=Caerostris extrusa TaxID=172846 RepID=A0AAV4QEM5_CAEEX|nr:hypothetical protein CEXT_812791 [Caerostris extrusa]
MAPFHVTDFCILKPLCFSPLSLQEPDAVTFWVQIDEICLQESEKFFIYFFSYNDGIQGPMNTTTLVCQDLAFMTLFQKGFRSSYPCINYILREMFTSPFYPEGHNRGYSLSSWSYFQKCKQP